MPDWLIYSKSRRVDAYVGEDGQTLPALTRSVLDSVITRKGPFIIRADVQTLQAGDSKENNLGYILESAIEVATSLKEQVRLEMIVHSMRAGKEQAIMTAIQDQSIGPRNISEDFGALPNDEIIAQRIAADINLNYATQESVLRWDGRFRTGELLGQMDYKAHPIIPSYELVEIDVPATADAPALHTAIISPRQVGVHPLKAAALVIPMRAAMGCEITRTFNRRWYSGIIDPEPITNPKAFADDLVKYWTEYRRNINNRIREGEVTSLISDDRLVKDGPRRAGLN